MNLYIYLLIVGGLINAIAFVLVGVDKSRSIDREERVPEVYFFFLATCFASLGVLLGMFAFRHKTRKMYFPLGISFLLLQQISLALYFTGVIN